VLEAGGDDQGDDGDDHVHVAGAPGADAAEEGQVGAESQHRSEQGEVTEGEEIGGGERRDERSADRQGEFGDHGGTVPRWNVIASQEVPQIRTGTTKSPRWFLPRTASLAESGPGG